MGQVSPTLEFQSFVRAADGDCVGGRLQMPLNVQVLEFTAQHRRGCRHTNRWCSQCVLHNNGQHKMRSVQQNEIRARGTNMFETLPQKTRPTVFG